VFICNKTGVVDMTECFGELGKVHNTIKFDTEAPFRIPGDKEGDLT
jgi:hypothetical protein